jgi:hypothetical protein
VGVYAVVFSNKQGPLEIAKCTDNSTLTDGYVSANNGSLMYIGHDTRLLDFSFLPVKRASQ